MVLDRTDAMTVTDLPALNATLNGIATVLLRAGVVVDPERPALGAPGGHALGAGRVGALPESRT